MKIGLYDMDSHNFPNLPLMKISAWHKSQGDDVEMVLPMMYYDKVYVSKVFGNEYSQEDLTCIQAKEIVYGGTGFAITINSEGKEVYTREKDKPLPSHIEHIYPDYSLYPNLTKDTAFGFLTRGCPNDCSFCIVSKKEGRCSQKVADLNEFWNGQKFIKLLDPNLLGCKEHIDLLKQLADSGASVDFTQGLDARFINESNIEFIKAVKVNGMHFAFDFMKNEKTVLKGLSIYKKHISIGQKCCDSAVYILTNYDTTFEEDMYRISKVMELGFSPYVMIYRKPTAPKILKHLQRWANNRLIHTTCKFEEYKPYTNGKTIKELYNL